MGLFGGSKKKTWTTQTTGATSTTTTPIVPPWGATLTQDTAGRVGNLLGLDPGSLVAPAQPLQQQAATWAGQLAPSPNNLAWSQQQTRGAADTSWLNPHMGADTPFASGGKAYNYIDNYRNPHTQEVVDTSAADFDANAGAVRAQQALDLAGSGAFGGSGAALTQSMTEGELARARGSLLSGLRSQGYQTALNAAMGDADRATQARIANAQTALQDRAQKVGWGFQGQQQQMQAANQLNGLQSGYDANQRDNIAAQAGLGSTFRDIDSQSRMAPVSSTQQIVAMLSGLPLSLFTGQQVNGTTSGTETGKSKETSNPGLMGMAGAFLNPFASGFGSTLGQGVAGKILGK